MMWAHCPAVKGWTKVTNFSNLDALSEAEWDKVRCQAILGNVN